MPSHSTCGSVLIVILSVIVAPAPCESGESLHVEPSTVGMSATRLQRITRAAQSFVDDGKLSGVVSLVARNGKIVYLEAVGWQDRERQMPMKTDTIFRIASMTKPITSLAVLMLYEEGKLQLTDPVSKYIPEFKEMKVQERDGTIVPAEREISVYDLLTHNSGLSYHWNERIGSMYLKAGIASGLGPDPDPIGIDVRALAKIPLAQQPGSGFLYGLNTDVLGHLVEVISDTTLDVFLRERFFEPLKMCDTKFFLDEKDVDRLARLYIRDENGGLKSETRDEAILGNNIPFGGNTPVKGPMRSF